MKGEKEGRRQGKEEKSYYYRGMEEDRTIMRHVYTYTVYMCTCTHVYCSHRTQSQGTNMEPFVDALLVEVMTTWPEASDLFSALEVTHTHPQLRQEGGGYMYTHTTQLRQEGGGYMYAHTTQLRQEGGRYMYTHTTQLRQEGGGYMYTHTTQLRQEGGGYMYTHTTQLRQEGGGYTYTHTLHN